MDHTLHLNRQDQSLVARKAEVSEIIDLRHRILRPGLPRSEAIFPGDDLPTSSHYGVFVNAPDSPAICCTTLHLSNWKDQLAYQLRGMATDPAWEGQGLGRAVQQVAIDSITAAAPIRLIWCNARLIAIPFYKKLGWTIQSELFEIPIAGPHYRMLLELSPDRIED